MNFHVENWTWSHGVGVSMDLMNFQLRFSPTRLSNRHPHHLHSTFNSHLNTTIIMAAVAMTLFTAWRIDAANASLLLPSLSLTWLCRHHHLGRSPVPVIVLHMPKCIMGSTVLDVVSACSHVPSKNTKHSRFLTWLLVENGERVSYLISFSVLFSCIK